MLVIIKKIVDNLLIFIHYLVDCVINIKQEEEYRVKQIKRDKFFMSQYENYSAALHGFVESYGVSIGIIPVENPRDLLCYDIYHGMLVNKFVFSVAVKEDFDINRAEKMLYRSFCIRYPEMHWKKTRIILSQEGNMLYIEFRNLVEIMGDCVVFDYFDKKIKVFSKDNNDLKLEIKPKEKFKILRNGRFVQTSFDVELLGYRYWFVWDRIRFSFFSGADGAVTVMDNVHIRC